MIPGGRYIIDIEAPVQLRSRVHLELAPDTGLKGLQEQGIAFVDDAVVRFTDVTDASLTGGRITVSGPPGDRVRNGIVINGNSRQVSIHGTTAEVAAIRPQRDRDYAFRDCS